MRFVAADGVFLRLEHLLAGILENLMLLLKVDYGEVA